MKFATVGKKIIKIVPQLEVKPCNKGLSITWDCHVYLQLLEPTLVVRCRQADQQLVESVIPAVCSRKSSMNTA